MRFGGLEILFVFAIVILFFGPKQIPKLTKVIKESVGNFKGENKEEEAMDTNENKSVESENSDNKE